MQMASNNKEVLDSLSQALKVWCDLSFRDSVNEVMGLKEHFLSNDLLEIRRVRWYSMHEPIEIERLWLKLVDNSTLDGELKNAVFDFYVTGATFIWTHTPVEQEVYNSFIKHLANTLGWVKRGTMVPDHVKEYAADTDVLIKLFTDNHWLVFLVMLGLTDIQ